MNKKITFISLFSSALILSGCTGSPEQNVSALAVSDFEYTMSGQQAVTITFGKDESHFCDATIHRAAVAEGLVIHAEQRSSKRLSVDCTLEG